MNFILNIWQRNLKFSKREKIYILPFEEEAKKPERKVYLYALKEIDLPPNNILYIDDAEEYESALKKMGINGIVFKNIEKLKKNY